MIVDKNRIFDGWRTLEGGVDGGRQPNTIDPTQCASAINMTFRGGSATTRPGFRRLTEIHPPVLANQTWCFKDRHQYDTTFRLWLFGNNHTMSDPGSGRVRVNKADMRLVDQMVISTHNSTGQDVAAILALLRAGHVINLEDNDDPAVWARFVITALPVNHTTWYLLHVGHTNGPLNAPANGDEMRLSFGMNSPTLLYYSGQYKPVGVALRNPNPPHEVIAPWFENQNSEYIYKNGVFQTASAYSPHNGEDCIMAMIGGRLFKIVPGVTTSKVNEVGIEDTGENVPHHLRNEQTQPIAYMCQADKWLVIQDGKSSAIIFDATKARRANTTTDVDHTEVPVGTLMAYGMGRLVVVVNERDVAFGDLYGSHDLPDPADSLLYFTERNFLAEGFDAAIPFQQGIATGMIFFPQLDTSTGNGQLMVFAERGSASFFLSLPREEWKTSTFQILSLLTTGLRGHRSIAVVNEDLWFRSDDGVRSYRQARSEQGGWAHIPLSTNVRQFLENDSDRELPFCSAIYFDNRVIMTTSPMWNNGRPVHKGVVVVDFDVLSSFGGSIQSPNASKPAWEGQWKGNFEPIQLLTGTFNGRTRAFMFAMGWNEEDQAYQNQLFEISKTDRDDWDGLIPWEMVTRTLDFQKLDPSQGTPFTENEMYDGDIWLREIIE